MIRVYFITGANRGIGLEMTKQLLEKGNKVVATARDPKKANELNQLATEFSLQLKIIPLDVADQASVDRLPSLLKDYRFIDVLINNAGMYEDRSSFASLDFGDLIQAFNTNTLGAMRVTRSLMSYLMGAEMGKVIHISSQMGSIKDNSSGGSYSYRMSKAALNMFNKSFSVDYPELISVVMHPGWVQTDMGGANARTPVQESVQGLLNYIEVFTERDSGCFVDFRGKSIEW